MKKALLLLLLTIIMVQPLLAVTSSMQEYNNAMYKIDESLLRVIGEDKNVQVIVVFHKTNYDQLVDARIRYGAEGVKRILRLKSLAAQSYYEEIINGLGGRVLNRFWIINAMLIEIKSGELPVIAGYPEVERIFPNFEVQVTDYRKDYNITVSSTVSSWGINKTKAPLVWEMGYNGSGIRICTIDTGVDVTHPALQGKMLTLDPSSPYYPGGWMEFDSSGNPILSEPHDTHGHGTHVSGTALGGDGDRIKIGMAPGATLMHALALPYGRGTFAAIIAALEWAADPYYIDPDTNEKVYTGMPAHIVSMSFGASNYYGSEFLEPIRNLLLLNIVPVASIGNSGYGSTSNPGNIWGVFGIGATDENDNVASFSSGAVVYWPYIPPSWPFNDTYPQLYIKPDFSAPGVRIVSSLPGGGYAAWSGTSMAAPHVAGLVALILDATRWDEYPVSDLPEKIYGILKSTSLDLGDPGQDPRYGWGIIDAQKAVEKALSIAKISGVKGQVLDDVDGSPIGYAVIYAYDSGGELVATARTNATGHYVIPLDPGHYTLVFTGFGYHNKSVEVDVVINNGTITGRVYDRMTGNPITGAEIIVEETGLKTYTDSSGSYTLSLYPGRYTLLVRAEGYFPAEKKIIVGEGEVLVIDHMLYPLNASATLVLRVEEFFTHKPIGGLNVSIKGTDKWNTTNTTGIAVIKGVEPGDYTVLIRGGKYAERIMEVALEPGVNEYSIETTYKIAIMSADISKFGEDIKNMLVQQGYPLYAITLLEPGEKKPGISVLIINYFGVDPGAEELLGLLEYYDEQNTSIILLDSWGAYYYFAGYTAYKYKSTLLSNGYPAPGGRNDGYETGVMLQALNTSHPIFSGISFDEGNKFYIASSPSDTVDYAAYPQILIPENTSLELLGELVRGATVYGYSVAIWSRSGEPEKTVLLSIGASYHWAMYMDKGQDMMYSDNVRKIIINTIRWLTGTLSEANTTSINNAIHTDSLFVKPEAYNWIVVRLERNPYGWLEGTIKAGDTGEPLVGVTIKILGTPIIVKTDENGYFKTWLPEGTYSVEISARGYYTTTITATIHVGGTTTISEELIRQPRALIVLDHMGQLKDLLRSSGWYAEDTRDWEQAISEAGFFDVIILAGEYMATHAFWPSEEQFNELLEKTYEYGIGIVFMNNYFEYRYLREFPYGINILYYYKHDPGSIGADYDKGPVYYKVVAEHPILEGYKAGDTIYVVDGGDYDYAWFNKWSGEIIAYIGSETSGVRGVGIGVKETEYGTRWVLLAGLAPEQWTNTEHWTEEAKEIFLRAVSWASYRIVNITIEPHRIHIGEELSITIPPLPGVVYSIILDTTVIYENILGGETPTTMRIKIPLLPMGPHKIVLISKGMYYGEATFYVEPKITILNQTFTNAEKIALNITGLPLHETILVFIDDNYISMAFTESVEPLLLLINIPDYIGSGYHTFNIRSSSGEIIGVSAFYIGETENERIIIMLDNINSRVGDITSIVSSIPYIIELIQDLSYNNSKSLDEIMEHLLETKQSITGLNKPINNLGDTLKELDDKITGISNTLQQLKTSIDTLKTDTTTRLDSLENKINSVSDKTGDMGEKLGMYSTMILLIVIVSILLEILIISRKK